MIAQGQEWGRSKVIASTDVADPNVGKLDHNSYEKDNETNWLNWDHRDMNLELVEFYKRMIELRKEHPALRYAHHSEIQFIDPQNDAVAVGYIIRSQDEEIAIFMNSDPKISSLFEFPEAKWKVIESTSDLRGMFTFRIKLGPSSGVVLEKI